MIAEARDDANETIGEIHSPNARITVRDVSVWYGEKMGIEHVSIDIGSNEVLALVGPSGCGKSTFLRCLNRMNDTIDGCRMTGSIRLDGEDIFDRKLDVVLLRARVGMVWCSRSRTPSRSRSTTTWPTGRASTVSRRPARTRTRSCGAASSGPASGTR